MEQLKEIIAFSNVMKHVTFTVKPSLIGPVSLFSNDPVEVAKRKLLLEEQEQRKKEQQENYDKINRAINHEYDKIKL